MIKSADQLRFEKVRQVIERLKTNPDLQPKVDRSGKAAAGAQWRDEDEHYLDEVRSQSIGSRESRLSMLELLKKSASWKNVECGVREIEEEETAEDEEAVRNISSRRMLKEKDKSDRQGGQAKNIGRYPTTCHPMDLTTQWT
jgi:hypothetical protein